MKLYSVVILCMGFIFLTSCGTNISTPDTSWDAVEQEDVVIQETSTETTDTNGEDAGKNKLYSQENNSFTFITDNETPIQINPISHATMVINWGEATMYIDPAEAVESYSDFSAPNVVLVTHEHGDHFNLEVLQEIVTDNVELIVNDGVFQKLTPELQGKAIVMANWDINELLGFEITAVPAYNIRQEALDFHPTGRDNGYVVESEGFRLYISWDTEDTPEMRALQDIDVAFVSMNLPFTMPVDSAISWVLDFSPKAIFPYHFRGRDGLSDIERFKTEVERENPDIQVVIAQWYE